jgi:hypothetical protein
MKYVIIYNRIPSTDYLNLETVQVGFDKIVRLKPKHMLERSLDGGAVLNSFEEAVVAAQQIVLSSLRHPATYGVAYYIIETDNDLEECISASWYDRDAKKSHKLSLLEKRFYVFDRDDTLIDKENHIINPLSIFPFFKALDSHEIRWGIVSSGASELKADEAYKALNEKIEFKAPPVYIQFNSSGASTLIAKTYKVHNIKAQWDQTIRNDQTIDEGKKAKIILDVIIAIAQKHELKLDMPIKIPKTESTFILSRDSSFYLYFGKTKIEVNISTFCANFEPIAKGQYKVFSVLMGLDAAKLQPKLTTELNQLGIKQIASPDDYQLINLKDVVFVDDRLDNCKAIQAAGATIVPADTMAANESKRGHNTTNVYLRKLEETLPLKVQDNYRSLLIQNIKEKVNRAILGKIDITNPKTELPAEDIDSYIGWMSKNTTGTRGITRFNHWFHGDSWKNRALKLLDMVNEPTPDLDDIINQIKTSFKDSSVHKHSLSRYLAAEFDQQDLNQLQSLNDGEFSEIKSHFQFNLK